MKCTNCFQDVPDEAIYCNFCGHRLKALDNIQQPVEEATPESRAPKKKGWIVLIGIAGTILLLGLVGVFLYNGGEAFGIFGKAIQTEIPDDAITPGKTNTPFSQKTPTWTVRPATGTPTRTPTPQTIVELPDFVAAGYENPSVFEYFEFTDLQDDDWGYSDQGIEVLPVAGGEFGAIKLTGAEDFSTYLTRNKPVQELQGVLISFLYDGSSPGLGIYLENGEWNTSSYKRYGAALWGSPDFILNIYEGTEFIGEPDPYWELNPAWWYMMALSVGDNGWLWVEVWERWSGEMIIGVGGPKVGDDLEWRFFMSADQGTSVVVYSYTGFTFTGLK
ncbi:MAG: zinc ribbon domain-containing protein [Chloroflexi bacterium]|nr:zinc ribbon domain-containing protein [Chloroflexota bacterium]